MKLNFSQNANQKLHVIISRLHERLNEDDQAAGAYTEFINNASVNGVSTVYRQRIH